MTQKYTFTQILEEIDKINIYPEDRITKNWKHYKNMHTIIGKPTNYTLKKTNLFLLYLKPLFNYLMATHKPLSPDVQNNTGCV